LKAIKVKVMEDNLNPQKLQINKKTLALFPSFFSSIKEKPEFFINF